jgi:NADPH-dependent 2,4-dienoyl-CoA reductase/sulfur reductase-like enzyme
VLPEKIATIVSQIHLDQGVSFHFHCSIQAIQDGTTIEILLKDRSLIKVDGVAVGIGAQPNDELARAAGLHVDDGIVVDEFGRTSAQGIYAAGDVTKHFNPLLKRYLRLETWQNAQNQGISVANVVAGMPKPFAEVPWAWSDQFGNNIQISGAPLRWDELVIRGNLSAKRFTAFQISQDTVVGAITLNNPREMRTAKRLIASGAKITLSKLADESQTID